jgi:hypothetical protein
VRISGLKARPELNKTVAVVLEPDNEEERQQVRQSDRVKVNGVPNCLSLKTENLTIVNEARERMDWTVSDYGGQLGSLCLKGMIELKNGRVGHLDNANEFVDTMLNVVGGGAFVPKKPFTREVWYDLLLNNTAHHCVYFCHFYQIAQGLVLETQAGNARVYQASITGPMDINGVMLTKPGYTAREWVATRPKSEWSTELRDAHARWGGGKELTRGELKELVR